MEQTEAVCYAHLHQLCKENPFISLLGIRIAALQDGSAVMTIPAVTDQHTNPYGYVHGGALASLADTVMGTACVTTGKRVWTLEMNINFIKNIPVGGSLTAHGKVIHNGKTTMVAEADIFDQDDRLLIKARGTFYVIGSFSDHPPTE